MTPKAPEDSPGALVEGCFVIGWNDDGEPFCRYEKCDPPLVYHYRDGKSLTQIYREYCKKGRR